MYLLFGYKNNSHCQIAVTVVQYSLSMAYTVSVAALQCICVPLGISVPGGFFIGKFSCSKMPFDLDYVFESDLCLLFSFNTLKLDVNKLISFIEAKSPSSEIIFNIPCLIQFFIVIKS